VIWLQGGVLFRALDCLRHLPDQAIAGDNVLGEIDPQAKRGLLAAFLMLGSIVPIFFALNLALQHNGFGNNGCRRSYGLFVGLFGWFCHGQTLEN